MILPQREAVFGLDAFLADARPHHFRQPIDVERGESHASLDLSPHRFGPWLGAENADAQARRAGIQPLPLELIRDRQHVGRRHHDDVGLEIVDQLHLPFGEAAAHRNDRRAEMLTAVVGT